MGCTTELCGDKPSFVRKRFVLTLDINFEKLQHKCDSIPNKGIQDMANENKEQVQQKPITVDESKAVSCYANFCRVTGSPEELIVDFGMNAQPMGSNDQPVNIQQRIVLNFYTAKRLLHALHVSVQRHEEVFGAIETDIQKRVKPRENVQS